MRRLSRAADFCVEPRWADLGLCLCRCGRCTSFTGEKQRAARVECVPRTACCLSPDCKTWTAWMRRATPWPWIWVSASWGISPYRFFRRCWARRARTSSSTAGKRPRAHPAPLTCAGFRATVRGCCGVTPLPLSSLGNGMGNSLRSEARLLAFIEKHRCFL